MKKLFALLLALCMMWGVMAAEAEATQTITAALAEFKVPADWVLEISQDEEHSFIAFVAIPGDQEAYISMQKAEYYDDCASQRECFESIYMGSHGLAELGDITITEDYAYMMPDNEPVVIGDRHDGSYAFAHRYSDVVVYLRASEDVVGAAIQMFASVTNPAIEANRGANADAAAAAEAEAKAMEGRIKVGNCNFALPEGMAESTRNQSDSFEVVTCRSESDTYRLMVGTIDYTVSSLPINTLGDESATTMYWVLQLTGLDAETAYDVVVEGGSVTGFPNGQKAWFCTTDSYIAISQYYRGTGIYIISMPGSTEAIEPSIEAALDMMKSLRMDSVTEEQMAADAEAARIAAEQAAMQKYIVITNSSANIRAKADSKSNRITTAYKGDTFPLLGEEGNWYKIEVNGQTAYVSQGLFEIKE